MKHKLIGKVWNKDPGKNIWYNVVRTSIDPIEIGDSLIIHELSEDMSEMSEYMDEFIVRPGNGTCNSDCWANCHLESPVCRHILNCNHYHPRVCLVHIGEVLEEL